MYCDCKQPREMPPRNASAAPVSEEATGEEAPQHVEHDQDHVADVTGDDDASASRPVRVYADGKRGSLRRACSVYWTLCDAELVSHVTFSCRNYNKQPNSLGCPWTVPRPA